MEWTEFSFILGPSEISGIGVFATHNILKGTQIFSGAHSPRKMITKDIPSDFLKYCIFLNDEECLCPERFDRMEIGWFLNHSHNPNVSITPEKKLVAICDIKAGEEILVDYNELNEPEHLKEAYYEKSQKC
ncbi:MAG: SET domain-containing protein [Alphaproteobacteria bacterium]|nr:SET domain-containing protein [Alphaproteobacteria bacterium]